MNPTEIKNKIPAKTGDFVADVRAGYYKSVRDAHFNLRDMPLFCFHDLPVNSFDDDFEQHLLSNGVPSQYVKKVAYCAYEQGHSSGESEIVNCAWDLISIFN
jgi:hypothetical protein